MVRVVTFGEVMIRLCPTDFLRVRQALPGQLEATFGGGELNVAVSVAYQGGDSAFMSLLPDNPLTDAFVQEVRKLGVDDSLIQRSQCGRFGIYFVETGANQRGGTVTYDRDHSSISLAGPEAYDWDEAFRDAGWLHITGITPAISELAARASIMAVQRAKQAGLIVSCDLNFRKKLWRWQPGTGPIDLCRQTMAEIMPHVDVVIANEEDADLALGIAASESDVDAGKLNLESYRQVAQTICERYPNLLKVAITLRESYSASHNNWGGLLYDSATQQACFAPLDEKGEYRPYEIRNIVDRVGAGDSFAGALIVALTTPALNETQSAIEYAVAASCLKHSIRGDFNYSTRDEIDALRKGSGSGRVQR